MKSVYLYLSSSPQWLAYWNINQDYCLYARACVQNNPVVMSPSLPFVQLV